MHACSVKMQMMKKTMLNSNNKSLSIFIIPLLFLFFFLLVLSTPSSAHGLELKSLFPQCPISKLISFGDSFTDTGNAKFLGGLIAFAKALVAGSPYGSTFFKDKPSNRLCDGRLVIDFLSEILGLPSFIPPYKDTSANFSFGVNFAIAGSTSLPGDFFHLNRVGRTLPWKDIPDSIQKQIDWFTEFMNGEHGVAYKAEMHNVLFWIGEMGGNDYLRTFGHSLKVETLTQMAVDHVCKVLQTCLDHGAKFVVVQALPPSGCSPLDMLLAPPYDRDMMGCAGSANAVIQAHNRLLQQRLKDYEKKYPGCMILYADYWGAYQAILENPILHGFEEPFKACCGGGGGLFNFDLHSICGATGTAKCADPSKYINWDGVHLTEAMYKKISELFFSKDYCKPSFGDLIRRRLSFESGGGASVSGSQGQGQQPGQANGGAQQSSDSGNQGQQPAQNTTEGDAQPSASGGATSSGSQGQQSAQNKGGAQQSGSGGVTSGSQSQGQQSAQNKGDAGAQQSGSGGATSGSQGQGQQPAQNKGDVGAQQSGSGGATSGSQGQSQQSSQNKGDIGAQQSGRGGATSGSQGQGQQSSQDKAGGVAQQSGSGGATSGSQGQGQQSSQDKAGGAAAQQSGSGGATSGSQGQGQGQQSGSGGATSGSQGQGQQSSQDKAGGAAQQFGKTGGSYESHSESSGSYEYKTGGDTQQQPGGSGDKSEMHFKGEKTFHYKTEEGMNVSCTCKYS